MKLSALQENFSQGLSIVGRGVSSRTTLPVTQNVLLSTENGQLKLTATNLEIAISTWIGAQIEQEGSITVPARLLTEFINSLPQERIDINMQEDPLGLNIECARFEAQINGITAEDFPPIPNVDTGAIGKISSDIFSKAVSHIAFVAATEDSRPVLTGVKVEITGKKFTLAAADGFRLAVYNGELVESISEDVSFIIPAKTLQEINRLANNQSSPVEFTVTPSKSQVLFRLDNIEIVSQLIQGTFPNYKTLIPDQYEVIKEKLERTIEEINNDIAAKEITQEEGNSKLKEADAKLKKNTRITVKTDDFLRATKTAAIFARDGSGIVRINTTEGNLSIASRAEEIGENQGEIDAKIEGYSSRIAFNSKYLMDVIEILGDGEVSLQTNGDDNPGVLRPINNSQNIEYVHIIMPIIVQS